MPAGGSLYCRRVGRRDTSAVRYEFTCYRALDAGIGMPGEMMCPPAGYGADFRVFEKG